MNRTLVLGIILVIIVIAVAVIYEQQVESDQKKEVTSMVDQAVLEIQGKGESFFPQFSNSNWYHGDIYIFVWQTDGIRVVYPPDPNGVGQNMTNLKDLTGKPIGKLFIETAANGGGWIEYLWPKPGTKVPTTKITYIKPAKYQDQTYLVGSGYYTN